MTIIGALAFFYFGSDTSKSAPAEGQKAGQSKGKKPLKLKLFTVTPSTWQQNIQLTAKLEAKSSIAIQSKSTGILTSLTYPQGGEVAKGAVLAILDTQSLELEAREANSRLTQRRLQLTRNQSVLTQMEKLSASGYVSSDELAAQKALVELAACRVAKVSSPKPTTASSAVSLVAISQRFASPGIAYGQKPSVPFVARLLPYFLPTAMLKANLAPSYGDPARLTASTVTRYRDMLLAPGVRRAILARTGQVVLEDPVPLLGRLQAPTLVLWGEKDGMIPFSNAADYMAAIPDATLVSLTDLGHVPHEEAPAVSIQPVRAFLAR